MVWYFVTVHITFHDARKKQARKGFRPIRARSYFRYSHLSIKRGGWNKLGGGAKVAKSLNVEVEINVEGGIFWKKLEHNFNKRGVEGGKI